MSEHFCLCTQPSPPLPVPPIQLIAGDALSLSLTKNCPFLILALNYKTKICPVRKCVFVQLGQTSSRSLKAVKDLSKSFPANIPIFLLLSISFCKGIQLGKYLWTNTFTFFYVNPEGGDQDAAKLNVSSFKGKEV